MTDRSRRDAAVARVLKALGEWHAVNGAYPSYSTSGRLQAAYEELLAIELELPDDARVNRGAPLTAEQAAKWMRGGRALSVAGQIVETLYWIGGQTVEGLEQHLNGKHQTISPRVNELRNSGWVYPFGTRETTSGSKAEVYFLTDRARELVAAAVRRS